MEITRRSFATGAAAVVATAGLPLPALSLETRPAQVLSPDVAEWRARFRDLFQTWWEAHQRYAAFDDAWDEAVDGEQYWTDTHEAAVSGHRNLYYRYFDQLHYPGAPDDKRFRGLAVALCYGKIYSDETLQVLGITEEQARVFTTSPQVLDWHEFGGDFETRGRRETI